MTHLVVLTHGLWGTPSHVQYIENQLNDAYPNVHVYKTGSHSEFRTYDGIDVNGQRVVDEILAETERLGNVTHLSIVGYSLGGLISRYAIGILYTEHYFDLVIPVNFVTMCTPHVGALNPLGGLKSRIANLFSHYFIGLTGSQLFLKDNVYGNPLLVAMADEESVFYKGLAQFQNRLVYANVMNDRRTFWYTAAMELTDLFHSMTNKRSDLLNVNFFEGFEPVIDMSKGVKFLGQKEGNHSKKGSQTEDSQGSSKAPQNEGSGNRLPIPSTVINRLKRSLLSFVSTLYHVGRISIFTPLFVLNFVGVSILERIRHNLRLREFFLNKSLDPYYLRDRQIEKESIVEAMYDVVNEDTVANLDTNQKYVISTLNKLLWNKFPVLITKTEHSHAAAIVRFPNPDFEEGKGVVKHLVDVTLGHGKLE